MPFRMILSFLCLLCINQAIADVRLPKIFDSHMVLQRNKPIPVWGWADAGEKVTVELSGSGITKQIKTIKAGKDGKWILRLNAAEAGGPYQLVVKGKKNVLTLDDVLIGEVWICSGQSNMQWTVKASDNAKEEIAAADYPLIRQFEVPREISLTPEDDLSKGQWKTATPENVGQFTAVGYFFGRELYKKLGIPIGLINTSWGGTIVETWISKEAMKSFNEFSDVVDAMPLSMEALGEKRKTRLTNAIDELQGGLPTAGDVQSWSSASFDDSNWKTIEVPGNFDRKDFQYLDGVVWFRSEFILPDSLAGLSVALSLGTIDDIDDTYVNGIKVGGTTSKTASGRIYILEPSQLHAGKNSIAVRIEDLGGRGGFTGKPEDVKISRGAYEQSLAGTWKFRIESYTDNNQFTGPNDAGTLLYNAMIAPLIPYAMQGAIWYQGESNAGRAFQYRKSFPLMISDWRNRWKEEFPFLFVQLASFNANNGNSKNGSTWAELREAQALTLQALPRTGMAVIHDIGNPQDIHPTNKQDVGKRLALRALEIAYGQNVLSQGPQFQSMQAEGNKLVLSFNNVGSGLIASGKYGYLQGFEIAGADKVFHWAKAEIRDGKVVVWSDTVTDPVAVHYGWADDNMEANLFNKEGLPAAPFRTDTWKGITEEVRFK
ncbi:sialate O-acetylesterase [Agriterribacter sp.]|uniref:sialate O-acetylesterase n=1 Tax=Agriterribacter sp. TaxID=2821509 RepID=UPI002D0CF434|nr:sialate O-acetylesterase [Agriterribacter sp.]HRO44290.1 sialate O-acetylesterase [Agriterribacter sp.]HRQ18240.1 sialate O-acetylesterase [Agriterribacter sp.]